MHFEDSINSAYLWTLSLVGGYNLVSIFGKVHHQRFHCSTLSSFGLHTVTMTMHAPVCILKVMNFITQLHSPPKTLVRHLSVNRPSGGVMGVSRRSCNNKQPLEKRAKPIPCAMQTCSDYSYITYNFRF